LPICLVDLVICNYLNSRIKFCQPFVMVTGWIQYFMISQKPWTVLAIPNYYISCNVLGNCCQSGVGVIYLHTLDQLWNTTHRFSLRIEFLIQESLNECKENFTKRLKGLESLTYSQRLLKLRSEILELHRL